MHLFFSTAWASRAAARSAGKADLAQRAAAVVVTSARCAPEQFFSFAGNGAGSKREAGDRFVALDSPF